MKPPPRLSRPGSDLGGWAGAWPAWLAAAFVALMALAWSVERWHLPQPGCRFKALTGFPCPLCGGTRALAAMARLDAGEAIRLNPLAVLLGAAAAGAMGVWAADRWLGTRCGRWLRRGAGWPWGWIALAILLINWAYLVMLALRHGAP